MESEFKEAKESPGFLLWQVTSIWQRHLRSELEKVELTHVQFVLLATCQWYNKHAEVEGMSQIQLSQQAKVDVNVTSKVLRTLETKKLVLRSPHLTDTRANVITLTPAGKALIAKANIIVEQADRQFFAKIDGEQAKLIQLLAQLAHE
jgi:MarR family transcriptional regulator, organic hydroperoxide resistance regulator